MSEITLPKGFESYLKKCPTQEGRKAFLWDNLEKMDAYQVAYAQQYIEDLAIEEAANESNGLVDYHLYDHSSFKVATKSWRVLNPDNLSYWEWLVKIGLPMFWKQPMAEYQHPLLAICCAINSNAVPYRTPQARRECSLPLLYFHGQSGSGKTEGNMIIAQSYAPGRFALIKGEATGCALRNQCHSLCFRNLVGEYPGMSNLYPAFLLIDNYEPAFLNRWGEHKTLLLSVLRSQAYTSTANLDGGNIYYYTHLLKSFTSVIPPKSMNLAQAEFNRRFLYFFTQKDSEAKSMGNYDFSDIPVLYNDLWEPNRVTDRFYPVIGQLLGMDDNETTIPSYRWQQSVLAMAVGVYTGILPSIEYAIDFMTGYWQWVETEIESSVTEVSTFLDELIVEHLISWRDSTLSLIGDIDDSDLDQHCQIQVTSVKDPIDKGIFLDRKGKYTQCQSYLKEVKGWEFHLMNTIKGTRGYYSLPPTRAIKALEELGIPLE